MEKLYKNVNGNRIELTAQEYNNFKLRQEQNIDEDKTLKINMLKNKYYNEITSVYPLSKQIDIIARIAGYTDRDFLEMRTFIENKINQYNEEKSK